MYKCVYYTWGTPRLPRRRGCNNNLINQTSGRVSRAVQLNFPNYVFKYYREFEQMTFLVIKTAHDVYGLINVSTDISQYSFLERKKLL